MNGSAEPPLRLLFDAAFTYFFLRPMSIKEAPLALKGGQFSAMNLGSQIFRGVHNTLECFIISPLDNIMTECLRVWRNVCNLIFQKPLHHYL